ncbi:Mitochondrial protein import protein [Venturia inaequalis]|nr:Mitochondrial protein import protein [Venturia inaequalis]
MLSPTPQSMIKQSQNSNKSPSQLEARPGDLTTPTKSQGINHDQPLKTPPSPSAIRDPSVKRRRKSVTFSDMLGTFPSPKTNHSAEQSECKVAPPRPARETPEGMPGIQRPFSDFEASLATAAGMRNVSSESSSTARQVSDGSMPPPSNTFKVRGDVVNSDFPIVSSPWKPKPALSHKPSDTSRTPSASSQYHSRQTSGSSRTPSSESKSVSKVKALAQAFNNLTALKESVKGRASSSSHKKSDSWTEKIRRSISGSSRKGVKEDKDLKATNEEVEPGSTIKEAHESEQAEAKDPGRLGLTRAASKVDEDEEKQPLLAISPPGSPYVVPTEPQSLEEALNALSFRNDKRVSMNLDPFSSAHSRFATGGLLPTLANEGAQLADSPGGSPSMELSDAPFVFPATVKSTRLDQDLDSPFDDESQELRGKQHSSFLAPQLNRKSSSIYSRSDNGGTPRKQGNPMVGGSSQTRFDNESSPRKQLGIENDPSPKQNTVLDDLHVHKRTPLAGSPSKIKGHGHKRSNAATPTAARTTSDINHSAYLAGTPSTNQSVRTHTPGGIAYSDYLAQDYTDYLDSNFPRDAAPPPIPARNPARLAHPSRRLEPVNLPPVSRQTSRGMDGSWDSPFPPHPHTQSHAQPSRQPSAYDDVPAQDPSWAIRLASAARAEVSRQSSIRASRQSSARNETSAYGIATQPLTDDTKARAHAEGARSGALARLKREARYPGRLGEEAADGLVGKEQFASEDRGDDSVFL